MVGGRASPADELDGMGGRGGWDHVRGGGITWVAGEIHSAGTTSAARHGMDALFRNLSLYWMARSLFSFARVLSLGVLCLTLTCVHGSIIVHRGPCWVSE